MMLIDVLEILPDGTQRIIQEEAVQQQKPDQAESLDEQRLSALETQKADRTELQAIWDTLAEAYQEGVNQA